MGPGPGLGAHAQWTLQADATNCVSRLHNSSAIAPAKAHTACMRAYSSRQPQDAMQGQPKDVMQRQAQGAMQAQADSTWRHVSSVTTASGEPSTKLHQRSSSRKRPLSNRRHASKARCVCERMGALSQAILVARATNLALLSSVGSLKNCTYTYLQVAFCWLATQEKDEPVEVVEEFWHHGFPGDLQPVRSDQ